MPKPCVPEIYGFITKDTLEGLLLQTENEGEEELEILYQNVKVSLDMVNSRATMKISSKIREIQDQLKTKFIVF